MDNLTHELYRAKALRLKSAAMVVLQDYYLAEAGYGATLPEEITNSAHWKELERACEAL